LQQNFCTLSVFLNILLGVVALEAAIVRLFSSMFDYSIIENIGDAAVEVFLEILFLLSWLWQG
jgi:hypothetical protein